MRYSRARGRWAHRLPLCPLSHLWWTHRRGLGPPPLVSNPPLPLSSLLVQNWTAKNRFGPEMHALPPSSEGECLRAAGCSAWRRRESNPRPKTRLSSPTLLQLALQLRQQVERIQRRRLVQLQCPECIQHLLVRGLQLRSGLGHTAE